MDIKDKQKILILAGIFGIVAIILYYNLLLKPQFLKFIVINREYKVVRARIRSAEDLILNKDRIKTQHDNFVKEVGLVEGRLSGHDKISGLLGDFSGVAESSGVKILKIKPLEVLPSGGDTAEAVGFYSEFPILIEASAGYHQCGTFINKLESMDRFIRIDDIDIKVRPGDPRHHDIKLRVATYVIQGQ